MTPESFTAHLIGKTLWENLLETHTPGLQDEILVRLANISYLSLLGFPSKAKGNPGVQKMLAFTKIFVSIFVNRFTSSRSTKHGHSQIFSVTFTQSVAPQKPKLTRQGDEIYIALSKLTRQE